MIHGGAVPDLRRTAVPPTVVGDDAVALSEEEQHLRVPVIRTQGPAMMKDNGLGALRPPILVENLCPVLGRSECHGLGSLFLGGMAHLGLSGCGDGGGHVSVTEHIAEYERVDRAGWHSKSPVDMDADQ